MKVSGRWVAILLCLLVVQIITYANGDKCHSIPTLNQPTQKITQTACDSFLWHGTTYTVSGVYIYQYPNSNLAEELILTINKSTSTTLTQTACDNFDWHGTTYTQSGSYQFVTTNAAGCTHTEILELTITKEISPAWYKTLGGVGNDGIYASEIDDNGNVYIMGLVENTFNFSAGNPATEITNGGRFIAKYNAQGNLIWAKRIPRANTTNSDIALDKYGNIYATSVFSGTNVDFDPDPNKTFTLSSTTNNIYVIKFSPEGEFLWAKNEYGFINTQSFFYFLKINVNEANDVTLLWNQRSNNSLLGRFVRLTDNGTTVWTKIFKPQGHVGANNFTTDASGNIYWVCSLSAAVDFSFDSQPSNVLTPLGTVDIVLSKINNTGDFIWSKQVSGPDVEGVYDIKLDESGSMFIVGWFFQTVTFGNSTYTSQGSSDAFLSKLDANGNFLWTKTWGGIRDDYAFGVATSPNGTIYVNGTFGSTVDFDPDPNKNYSLNSVTSAEESFVGGLDDFLSKFTSQGEFVTASQRGIISSKISNPVKINLSEDVLISGAFASKIYLIGPDGPFSESEDRSDMYFIKYNSCVPKSITNITACDSYSWNGTTYNQSGNYLFLNPVTNSTEELNLTINKSTTTTLTQTACDSFEWHGTTYTESGSHQFVTTNAVGCTHTETLELTITKSTTTTLTQTACDSFEWHGTTYTESGSHQFVTTNSVGCTHTETLALTITKSTNSTLTQTACDSFEWHGTTYTESGTYQFTSTNAAGCTHIETLDLKINKSTLSMQTKTTCDSFEWNGITYTESGTYQFTSTNAASCTHIETLDLKINKSTSSMQTKTTCDSFEWNGKTYTQSGAYQFKTTNEVGCTHTDNLDLEIVLFDETLTYANNLLTVKQSNVDYQWINCNNGKTIEGEINQFFKPKENGKYAVIMSIGECKKQSECFEVADLTELEFKVYPNPFTTEVLTIVIPDTTDYEIVFLNSLGIEMVNYKGNSSNFLNVNFVYESGVYIVILKQNGKIKSLKLVRD